MKFHFGLNAVIVEANNEIEAFDIVSASHGYDNLDLDAYFPLIDDAKKLNNTFYHRQILSLIFQAEIEPDSIGYVISRMDNRITVDSDLPKELVTFAEVKVIFDRLVNAGLILYCENLGSYFSTPSGQKQLILWLLETQNNRRVRIPLNDVSECYNNCRDAKGEICSCRCLGKNHSLARVA
jgi:hypothetical protein